MQVVRTRPGGAAAAGVEQAVPTAGRAHPVDAHSRQRAPARAGERIVSYQVCDWILPLPAETLLGRGHVGDGHIDFPPITAAVAAAGYTGYIETEIFNQTIWDAPADDTATTVAKRYPTIF